MTVLPCRGESSNEKADGHFAILLKNTVWKVSVGLPYFIYWGQRELENPKSKNDVEASKGLVSLAHHRIISGLSVENRCTVLTVLLYYHYYSTTVSIRTEHSQRKVQHQCPDLLTLIILLFAESYLQHSTAYLQFISSLSSIFSH